MIKSKVILLCFIVNVIVIKQITAKCNFDVKRLKPEPIIIRSGASTFLYPNHGVGQVEVNPRESITITCPGGEVIIGTTRSRAPIQATCQGGQRFLVNGQTITFPQIRCSTPITDLARYTGGTCEQNGREAEIGFAINGNTFLRQIRVCFDSRSLNVLYTQFQLTQSISEFEVNVARPNFTQDGTTFYNLGRQTVNALYSRYVQRVTINTLLGLTTTDNRYVQDGQLGDYLTRGHLAAKADFFYEPQQLATFHLINAAPQWYSFNEGSWNDLEMQVRDFADSRAINLEIYTGTYGISQLPHARTQRGVDLYLYVNRQTKAIPVPELFWKVVYDPISSRGVALVGINNPYKRNIQSSIICNDVSGSIRWIHWSARNIYDPRGYTYACEVGRLRVRVLHVPNLHISGLLV